jgi:hypothetical protein
MTLITPRSLGSHLGIDNLPSTIALRAARFRLSLIGRPLRRLNHKSDIGGGVPFFGTLSPSRAQPQLALYERPILPCASLDGARDDNRLK